MRRTWMVGVWLAACALAAAAQNTVPDPMQLLDHLAGDWVLTGTIVGWRPGDCYGGE